MAARHHFDAPDLTTDLATARTTEGGAAARSLPRQVPTTGARSKTWDGQRAGLPTHPPRGADPAAVLEDRRLGSDSRHRLPGWRQRREHRSRRDAVGAGGDRVRPRPDPADRRHDLAAARPPGRRVPVPARPCRAVPCRAQVPITDIVTPTGLDLGPLVAADRFPVAAPAGAGDLTPATVTVAAARCACRHHAVARGGRALRVHYAMLDR